MNNTRLKRLLMLFVLLLVILLTINILRQIKTIKPTKSSPAVSSIRAAAGTNIIICVLDAARPDHFGCYGYPRPTTPNIDRLAKESLVFEQHYAQVPETAISTLALFESRYIVPEKKARAVSDYIAAFPSLVEALQQLGFNTMFLSVNPKLLVETALLKGFNNITGTAYSKSAMEQKKELLSQTKSAQGLEQVSFYRPENLLGDINNWLALKPEQPIFAYIHFVQPHIPYDAPKNLKDIFAGKKPPLYWSAPSALRPAGQEQSKWTAGFALAGSAEETVNLYDANLRWADESVGKLEQALRKAGLFDNTLLIIMADHGETLGEHGYNWHPDCPYEEALHIPLIMRFPGKDAPRGRIKALTQTVDLLPTLFDLHDAPCPASAKGRSLLPLMAGETAQINEYSFSTAGKISRCEIYIARDLQSTLILRDDGKTRALYDTVKDPHQTKNIIKSDPKRAAKLIEAFRQFALAQPYPPLHFIDPTKKWVMEENPELTKTEELPEELKEQLKTLGYLK
jgi:arylsulfatase A-like enzyme